MTNTNQKTSSGLVRGTAVVLAATLASTVIGLFREMLIAHQFGATVDTDAYFFCYSLMVGLPDFLLGAVAAGLIPTYNRAKADGDESKFVNTIIHLYLIFLAFVAGIVVVAAPLIASSLASGFDSQTQHLVTRFLWIMSPTILLTGLWGIFKTLLEAEKQFFVANISGVFLSLGIIGSVLLLTSVIGSQSLPVGILIASVLQMLWVAYWVSRAGFRYRLTIATRDTQFRKFLWLLGPGIIGGVFGAIMPIIDKSMASHLPQGTVASLSFAARPMGLLTRFAVYSFVTALLPTLSLQSLRDSAGGFQSLVSRTLGILVFAVTPGSILLAVLRVPIIQLLFERGKFGPEATQGTATIFAGFVLGLMPMAIAVTVSTVFKSLEDTKTPAFYGAGSILVSKVAFNFLLIGPLGALGLATASSLKYVVGGVLLLLLLWRRLPDLAVPRLATTLVKALIGSFFAALPVQWIVSNGSLAPPISLFGGLMVGGLIYIAISALLRSSELSILWNYLLVFKNEHILRSA